MPYRFSLELDGTEKTLPKRGSWPETKHRFDLPSCLAVNAALSSKRPLLLGGEPGIGKSQLARAVAEELGVPFLPFVVNEKTERDDLLFKYDAVSRLAQAQLLSVAKSKNSTKKKTESEKSEDPLEKMAEERFVKPGVFWWACNWEDAETQEKEFFKQGDPPWDAGDWSQTGENKSEYGPVLLIDEIDKADPSVPNGLLECLGNHGFLVEILGRHVRPPEGAPEPLIIITTNEERDLPRAFLRRCMVYDMKFPSGDAGIEFLLGRARAHVDEALVSDDVCIKVAKKLLDDREKVGARSIARPGVAEFLDILRALADIHPGNAEEQKATLAEIGGFALDKSLGKENGR